MKRNIISIFQLNYEIATGVCPRQITVLGVNNSVVSIKRKIGPILTESQKAVVP